MSNASIITRRTGAARFDSWQARVGMLMLFTIVAAATYKMGLLVALAALALPIGIFFVADLFLNPQKVLTWTLVMAFFTAGLGRYVSAPFGLTIDMFLFVGVLGYLMREVGTEKWTKILNNDVLWAQLVWYGMLMLELVNPEAHSPVAWFYAMRAFGFYQILIAIIVLRYCRDYRYIDKFFNIVFVISLIGTLWGLRQMIFGLDAAEHHWIYVDGHKKTHILHGVLRVFSFYSDAGQFGASQAMVLLMAAVLCMGPYSLWQKAWYGIVAFMTLIGFGISGTRGALFVPAAGAIAYLVVSKNYKILALGLGGMFTVFFILKFTFLFQGVEQVRRMRTALDPNDASFQVRLDNQKKFRKYLATRPLGGGVGTAGFWGARFSPNTFLATTATDSWYVKVWAETGIIGVSLYLAVMLFLGGKAGYIIWNLENDYIKFKAMAMFGAYFGVLFASYGNSVIGQIPTSVILAMCLPLIYLCPLYERQIAREEAEKARLEEEKRKRNAYTY
ncbi:MAG: O-antigen ligase family protein [Bacteroidota bacterium]